MKIWTKVAVCHDGKWSRRVQGEVIATKRGYSVKVRFPHPESLYPVEFWAKKVPAVRYCRNKPPSCIFYGKRYAYFGGWADIDWFCPWYSVLKWKDKNGN